MTRDVFISYSSKNRDAADAVCAALEAGGVPCWMAPRDILAGVEYSEAIIDAIENCKVMVLIFSKHCNDSPPLKREVERAMNKRVPIVTFRIENVEPDRSLEFFLCIAHWFDAHTPPLERHFPALVNTVKEQLSGKKADRPMRVSSPILAVRRTGIRLESPWVRAVLAAAACLLLALGIKHFLFPAKTDELKSRDDKPDPSSGQKKPEPSPPDADSAYESGDFDQAVPMYEAALKLNPYDVELERKLASARRARERMDKTRASIRQVLADANASAENNYATLYGEKWFQAEELIADLLKTRPGDPQAQTLWKDLHKKRPLRVVFVGDQARACGISVNGFSNRDHAAEFSGLASPGEVLVLWNPCFVFMDIYDDYEVLRSDGSPVLYVKYEGRASYTANNLNGPWNLTEINATDEEGLALLEKATAPVLDVYVKDLKSPRTVAAVKHARTYGLHVEALDGLEDIHDLDALHLLYISFDKERPEAKHLIGFKNLKQLILCGGLPNLKELRQLKNLELLNVLSPELDDIGGLENLTRLSTLKLRSCGKLGELGPIRALKQLRTFELEGTPLRDFSALNSLSGLTQIKLGNLEIRDLSLLEKLYNIEKLDIRDCTELADIGALEQMKQLADIYLLRLGIADAGVLAKLPHLTVLSLDNCPNLRDLKALEKAESLSMLVLDTLPIRALPPLDRLSNLNSLSVISCDQLKSLAGVEKKR